MLSVVVLCLLSLLTIRANAANQVIKTKYGPVEGTKMTSYEGRPVTSFLGVPYAKPPVGPLRFKVPHPVEPWTTTLLANTSYVCIQIPPIYASFDSSGTEDCLYLYIYVPRETITGTENFDVIVGIHGGAFMLGDPHILAGPGYLMDRDVVYVSMTYRLGILGFLSAEDEVLPGNNGMKDQVQALKWINENIKCFGGNPNSVTLLGLSAGGAAVHYHHLSPMSKGLFHRGLSQSGNTLNPWAFTEKPAARTKRLAAEFNCTRATTSDMVECLRHIDAVTLLAATDDFYLMLRCIPFTPFGPVIEKGEHPFLPDHPYKLLLDGKMHDVPWITSSTSDEGIFPVGFVMVFEKIDVLNDNWNRDLSAALDYNYTIDEADKLFVAERIRDFYFKNETLTTDNIDILIKLFGDRLFLSGSEDAARLHAKTSKSPVYFYLFDYKLEMDGFFPLEGVGHTDDARLLYTIVGNPSKLPPNDEKLKNMFIDFVTDYAAGRELKFGGVQWKPVEPVSTECFNGLHISGPENIRMDSYKEIAPQGFWKSLPIIDHEKLYPK